MHDHAYALSDDFISMLAHASHVPDIPSREQEVFHILESALKQRNLSLAACEAVLSAWTAYIVKNLDQITGIEASAHEVAASLYLAFDLHLSVETSKLERKTLFAMFFPQKTFNEADYAVIAAIAKPIFSYFSELSPDVLTVISQELHKHQHVRHHATHAQQIHALASEFWQSSPALDKLDATPRVQLIFRLEIVPNEAQQPTTEDSPPEPSCFFLVKEAQSKSPRILLPWFGDLTPELKTHAMCRVALEAMLSPHHGTPAIPVALVAPSAQDVAALTQHLGIPEVVILSPEQLPE